MMPVREAIGRFKYVHEDELDENYVQIKEQLDEEVKEATGKEDF